MLNRDDASALSEITDARVNQRLSDLRTSLMHYCELLCGSHHEAEDIVQTTLLKALPFLQGVRQHPNVEALVRRIARNSWVDHVRKQSKLLLYSPQRFAALGGSALLAEHSELESALQILLHRLTPSQRTVFLLCAMFEYTAREAAKLLGISLGAAKAALHRARARLDSTPLDYTWRVTAADDGQKKILKAYLAAIQTGDVRMLIHLGQDGVLDPVQATSVVVTRAKRKCGAAKAHRQTNVSTSSPVKLTAA